MISTDSKIRHMVLCLRVHQPKRLRKVAPMKPSVDYSFFDNEVSAREIRRLAMHNYTPANDTLFDLIQRNPQIRVAFSISGVALEQLQQYAPEVITGFQRLVNTGAVEFLGETYYHSMASLVDSDEFEVQILQHAEKLVELFGVRPAVFRNTELIYSEKIARRVAALGFQGMIVKGSDNISAHHPVHLPDLSHFKLVSAYHLSGMFAFGEEESVANPTDVLAELPAGDGISTLELEYGSPYQHSSGAGLLKEFFGAIISSGAIELHHPAEVISRWPSIAESSSVQKPLRSPEWFGNEMQKKAFTTLMKFESDIKSLGELQLLQQWRYLQSSDHFFNMSVIRRDESTTHSPDEVFFRFMNVLSHLSTTILSKRQLQGRTEHDLSPWEAKRQDQKSHTPPWVMELESVPQGNIPEKHN